MRDHAALKTEALAIFRAGLDAVDPGAAVRACVERRGDTLTVRAPAGPASSYDLAGFESVVVVGAGKATAAMAAAVEGLLGERIDRGAIVVKTGHALPLDRIEVTEAAHPIPDRAGRAGAARIAEILEEAGPTTLVISLISGGGSALLPLPAEGITLDEKQRVTDLLLAAGAEIGEINAVRKHISAIKGGQLARRAFPATVVNLMLSDVVGDRVDVIASGPAVPDASTYADAHAVLVRHHLAGRVQGNVLDHLERGVAGEIAENPAAGDPVFARCFNAVIAGNRVALHACAAAARARGWRTTLLSSTVEGETREVARVHAAIAREVRASGNPIAPPACIVSGGETTVTVSGRGRGGRNQEFALAAALDLDGLEGVAVFSAGTDGTDGPTDAAGGIAFGDTVARIRAGNRSARAHLDDNDAYPILDALGDLVRTGPTGTNVMDVHLILVSN